MSMHGIREHDDNRPFILIVDDNSDFAFGLRLNLEVEGYRVEVASSGEFALQRLAEASADLVLLDLILPGIDGFQVLDKLRLDRPEICVIALSGRSEEHDRIAALRRGASDYVCKPFNLLELLERVRIQLRQRISFESARVRARECEAIRIGQSLVDVNSRRIVRKGFEKPLSPKEFELLLALWQAAGTVVSKQVLLRNVWGFSRPVMTRTVDFHIAALRAKLEPDPARPRHVLTVRGVGYRLVV